MALYVSIDEGYSVTKLNGLEYVVRECSGYTLKDGSKVTKTVAQQKLKNGSFNVYEYDTDGLEEAKRNGFIRGVDWTLKIQKI